MLTQTFTLSINIDDDRDFSTDDVASPRTSSTRDLSRSSHAHRSAVIVAAQLTSNDDDICDRESLIGHADAF